MPLSNPLNALSFSLFGIFLNSQHRCAVRWCILVGYDNVKHAFCPLRQSLATESILSLVLDDLDALGVQCLLELVEVDAWSG